MGAEGFPDGAKSVEGNKGNYGCFLAQSANDG